MNKNKDSIWIASFDIGKKNFAVYIEEVFPDQIKNLYPIDKKNRYNADGTPTNQFENVINKIYDSGRTIFMENTDLTEGCDPSKYLDENTYYNMGDYLDCREHIWKLCDHVIIEKQMSFGKRHNTMALKLGQHCWSYFSIKFGRLINICEFSAYHKTQSLGAPKIKYKRGKKEYYKSVDKTTRKKWGIDKASEILLGREEYEALEKLLSYKKKDDISDCIIQLQAYKVINFYDL